MLRSLGLFFTPFSPSFLHSPVVTFPAPVAVTEGVGSEGTTVGHLSHVPAQAGSCHSTGSSPGTPRTGSATSAAQPRRHRLTEIPPRPLPSLSGTARVTSDAAANGGLCLIGGEHVRCIFTRRARCLLRCRAAAANSSLCLGGSCIFMYAYP